MLRKYYNSGNLQDTQAREAGRLNTDLHLSLCSCKHNLQSIPLLCRKLPAASSLLSAPISCSSQRNSPPIFLSLIHLHYLSPQFQKTFPGYPQVTLASEIGQLIEDLHLSLHSSKTNHQVLFPDLQQTTYCSYSQSLPIFPGKQTYCERIPCFTPYHTPLEKSHLLDHPLSFQVSIPRKTSYGDPPCSYMIYYIYIYISIPQAFPTRQQPMHSPVNQRGTETKRQNSHPTKTKPDISTQNYSLLKFSFISVSKKAQSITARKTCLYKILASLAQEFLRITHSGTTRQNHYITYINTIEVLKEEMDKFLKKSMKTQKSTVERHE